MTSQKQKQANKKNAQLSAGPKTPGGKANVAKNALSHGIFTKELVIQTGGGGEDLNEYTALLEGLRAELLPKGTMQDYLVQRIAVDIWRERRVIRFESGKIAEVLDDFKINLMRNYYKHDLGDHQSNGPRKLYHMPYIREISKEKLDEQISFVIALKNPNVDITYLEKAYKYILIHQFKGEEGKPTEESLNKVRQYIENLPLDEKEELRNNLLLDQLEVLDEMNLVHDLHANLNQIYYLRSLPNADDLEKITKYQTSLGKSIRQNLATLLSLQKNRKKAINLNETE